MGARKMKSSMATSVFGAVVTASALCFTLAGCSGTSEPTATLPGSSSASGSVASTSTGGAQPSTASGTTSIADTQRQVLDAYLGMQRAFDSASETADPGYPDLARYASGPALQRLTAGLTSMRNVGLRGRGKTVFHPKVQELAPAKVPTRAQVVDCMDTRGTSVYKANGQPYKDTPGGWRLVNATVELHAGVWKVTGVGIHEVGSCTG
jgi:hypothetical protein